MVYAITYDLNKPHQDYPRLFQRIENERSAIHALQNLWFVQSSSDATRIAQNLHAVVDANDAIFVSRVDKNDYYGWLTKAAQDWLESRL